MNLERAEAYMERCKRELEDAARRASYAVEHEQERLREYRAACLIVEKLVLNYEI